MIDFFITLFTYIFDLFILKTFLDNTFIIRKVNISHHLYYGSFILTEIILFCCQYFYAEHFNNNTKIINIAASFFTTFCLCFLYKSTMAHRLFICITFQIFVSISELIFSTIVTNIRPFSTDNISPTLITFMNLGSKIVLLTLTLIFTLFWNKYFSHYKLQYNLLLLITPLITFFILLFLPLQNYLSSETETYDFNMILFLCLTIFNIGNYLLLENTFKTAELSYEYKQMQQQLDFQKEKYRQLSVAYKNTRSVVHDTKKHYLTIQEFISQKNYDKLSGYLYTACENLESTYARYNTGNLVIDSLLTNYKNIAEQNGIKFIDEINLTSENIPVEDYDLCIIIGNLLDNSINACIRSDDYEKFINIQIIIDDNDKFIIHIKNTLPYDTEMKNNEYNEIDHGFGMRNIENMVNKYHGMQKIIAADYYETLIVIPILDVKKRKHPPLN